MYKKRFSLRPGCPCPLALMTLAASGMISTAHAQSSVTLYGVIDAGIGYLSNAGGQTQISALTGTIQNNRLGFKGIEDLGGGTSAVFVLENGFSTQTGAAGQGGALFGRQAFVGLSDKKLGTLTAGLQYDMLGATLSQYETSTYLLGNYADHPFGNDRANSLRVANAVKYQSTDWNGLQFGAAYAFSNLAGNINGTGRSYSTGVSYTRGPWSVGAAYVEVAGTTLDISSLTGRPTGTVVIGGSYLRSMGVGASYTYSRGLIYAMYTQALYAGVRGQGVENGLFRNGHLGFTYFIRPDISAGAAYALTQIGDIKLHQISTTLDYAFSKRTDVYTQYMAQHAAGNNAHANFINLSGSSGRNQMLVDVGIRHKF